MTRQASISLIHCSCEKHFIFQQHHVDIFVKNVMPIYHGNKSAAVSILYRGNDGTPVKVSFKPKDYGLNHEGGYMVSDVFTGQNLGSVLPDYQVQYMVNPNGNTKRKIKTDSK
jgi:hypothetical protein